MPADLKVSSPVLYGGSSSYSVSSRRYGSSNSTSSTSSYSSSYSSYGSKYRTSSLERSNPTTPLRESILSLRPTESKYSYSLASSRPPRPTSPTSTRKSEGLRSRLTNFDRTTPLKVTPTRISNTKVDALHVDYQSPVLTRYRRNLSENYLGTSSRTARSIERTGSVKSHESDPSSRNFGSLTSLPGETESRVGGYGSSSVDENSNAVRTRRSRYDNNHNNDLNGESESSSGGENYLSSGSSPTPPRHHKTNSNASSGSSGYSSGYGSDNASSPSLSSASSSVHELGRRSRDSLDKAGLVGLRNLGNTCFMNSILQCLSNTQPLIDYSLKEHHYSEINTTTSSMKGALIKAYVNLMKSMWKGASSSYSDNVVSPQDFKRQIEQFSPRFAGYSQQDSQELLRYVLSGLHEDVNRVTSRPKSALPDIDDDLSDSLRAAESWKRYLRYDNSKIVDLFVGQLKSTLKCTVCGHCSVTFDPFWDLSLPIPKGSGSVKLSQCLDLFTSEETLDGDEKPTCSRCKTRRKCTKSFSIYKFPVILVLHLKRFSPNERFRAKLSTCVDFPVNRLNLNSYAATNSPDNSCVYNLYAVSNHSGTTYSGHYTAFCKNPYSQEWHDFNDSRVSSISTNSIVTSEAYVLFYEQASQTSRL